MTPITGLRTAAAAADLHVSWTSQSFVELGADALSVAASSLFVAHILADVVWFGVSNEEKERKEEEKIELGVGWWGIGLVRAGAGECGRAEDWRDWDRGKAGEGRDDDTHCVKFVWTVWERGSYCPERLLYTGVGGASMNAVSSA